MSVRGDLLSCCPSLSSFLAVVSPIHGCSEYPEVPLLPLLNRSWGENGMKKNNLTGQDKHRTALTSVRGKASSTWGKLIYNQLK